MWRFPTSHPEAVASAHAAFTALEMPLSVALFYDGRRQFLEKEIRACGTQTLDTGKAIQETSAIDVINGVEVLEYYAGIAQSLQGSHVDLPPEAFAIMRREPLGVRGDRSMGYPIPYECTGISLWQYRGIQKPSEVTPLTALSWLKYTGGWTTRGCFQCCFGRR